MLSALSHARETQHYAKQSGLGVTWHSPAVEAIKSSEVDIYKTKKNRTPVTASSPPSLVAASLAGTKSAPSGVRQTGSQLSTTAAVEEEGDILVQPREKEKKYQSFTAEGMQIALLATVVVLVGVNAYAFETLGAERTARQQISARLARVEGVLGSAAAAGAGVGVGRATADVGVQAVPLLVSQSQSRSVPLRSSMVEGVRKGEVVQSRGVTERMANGVKSLFWAS